MLVCLRVPRPALRHGRDEGLYQLAFLSIRLVAEADAAALRSIFHWEVRVTGLVRGRDA